MWIPAHKGHSGNERADELAKLGTKTEDKSKMIRTGCPLSCVTAKLLKCIYDKWETEWKASPTANHAKSFYQGPDRHKARYVYKLARLELGRLVRIVTGHNNLNFFQHKLGYTDTPECRLCGEGDETITHLMTACPPLRASVNDIFGSQTPTPDRKWSVRNLINFSNLPSVNRAYEGSGRTNPDLSSPEEEDLNISVIFSQQDE